MYAFTALFIYAVLRTTTAINEQAFLAVRPPIVVSASDADADDEAEGVGGGMQAELPLPPTVSASAFKLPWRVRKLLEGLDDARSAIAESSGDVEAAGSLAAAVRAAVTLASAAESGTPPLTLTV